MRAILVALVSTAGFAATAAAQEEESFSAHFQSTYVWQRKPAMRSPYEGPNSLLGAAEKSYSFTATGAFGLRLGPATEIYFNPEVAQGVPLSGLLGLSGFTNGELAKTSGSNPTLYRARLFVRHTIGLGGEREAVPGAFNQLAGSADSRRIVVTFGALSALDLFDLNAYAHDPRTQFMNWALMTHAAYDYPADSRGYTYGAAAEYFDGDWSTRIARFAQPREPNQLSLDPHLSRHYGDQAELVRKYKLGERPGAVRLLAYRSRTVMANYDAALAAAPLGSVPTLDSARDRERIKTAFGIAAEQEIAPDVGVFARLMKADGKSETYAFTESDRSASAGVSVAGARWGRPKDVFGAALASSGLSAGHRAFLERGGQTFFLGDGHLRYAAERVVEVYYSFAIGKGASITANYQRVASPGFNADRGPASFYGIRLHWEN